MFAKNRPVGYTADGLLQIQKRSADFYGKSDLLRNELMKTGTISSMAESGGKVTGVWQWNGGFTWKGKDAFLDPHFGTLGVTQEYGKTVGWQFTRGRDFSKELATDSSALIINETAAKLMGLRKSGRRIHKLGNVLEKIKTISNYRGNKRYGNGFSI